MKLHTSIGNKNVKHTYLVSFILQSPRNDFDIDAKRGGQPIENLFRFSSVSAKIFVVPFTYHGILEKSEKNFEGKKKFIAHIKNIQNTIIKKRNCEHFRRNRSKWSIYFDHTELRNWFKRFSMCYTIVFSANGTVIAWMSVEKWIWGICAGHF